ncbi:glycosyl hydrolase [Niabella aquatica]
MHLKLLSYLLGLLIAAPMMIGCSKNKDKPEVVSKPLKFLYSTPEAGAQDVALTSEVSVAFNEAVTLASNHEIKVNGSAAPVTTNDRKLVFNISLEPGKTYEISIPAGAVKSSTGEATAPITFSFSTISGRKMYEAENAALSGNAIVEKSLTGYSGTGYVNQKDGDLLFKVNVPEAGQYKLTFRFANGNSYKENDLVVNGAVLAKVAFEATNDWKLVSVNKVTLKPGENIILIKKNWGWTFYDYLEVSPADPGIAFNISPALITPSPTKEAVNVYNFLKENFGKSVISGAMANYSTGLEEATWMNQNTGKWPALTGFDFINYTRSWGTINFTELVSNSIGWWNNNGLVTIMWHWRDPLKTTDEFYTERTAFDVSKITDVNSNEYKAMIADIDVIAGYLKQLKDNNVPVLWRPLHEASGKWFWWGAKGAAPCKELWKVMYKRLAEHHGLNNLIWVWTSDAAPDATTWYPGDDYVDIIGMDIYPGENQHGSQYIAFDKVKEMFGGKKMITLSECGSIPSIDAMFEKGDTWSWFMPWNGDYTRIDKHNGANFLKAVFGNSKVITRDKMPVLK